MFTNKELFQYSFVNKVESMFGKNLKETTDFEKFQALSTMIREYIGQRWSKTNNCYRDQHVKQVYYFSIEYLLGRLLENNLTNLGIYELVESGLKELGIDLQKIAEQEVDAGLGSGGLGRLAACFLDSFASLSIPGHGYGIRYRHGLFEQKIVDGYQMELPDYWLQEGYAWEVRRIDRAVEVKFGGNVQMEEKNGRLIFHYSGYESVLAVPYYVPIVGFRNQIVNTLRLWSAEPVIRDFDLRSLSIRDYNKIIEYKRNTEAISGFLYPNDNNKAGKILRLKQQYFLVSASMQNIIANFKKRYHNIHLLPDKVAIHINDTHPAVAIPELMRILLDEEGLSWDEAWDIATRTFSYTNHTILSEALETWDIELFKNLLPRIFMIIAEINERFTRALWERYPGNWELIHRMAVVADGVIKMAHLAIVGSYSVNGVSAIHTEILKNKVMNLFYQYTPDKFNNKTNGITQRRWLVTANPKLTKVINELIGEKWISKPSELLELKKFLQDEKVLSDLNDIKLANKKVLAKFIEEKYDIFIDPTSIFDVQIKRIHAYKRQLLNILHIMYLYNRLREDSTWEIMPRTFIFAGKAAPNYFLAKSIIKLINSVANIINKDKKINEKIKVIFLENYGVTLAERIIPAADVSEQISTASQEASGTGNMKLMMNGALTIGTLDGANIEIMEEVGEDNIYTFGLTADEVLGYYQNGGYKARDIYNSDKRIRVVLDQLTNGFFHCGYVEFNAIYDFLLTHNDPYFVLRDFASYVETQERINNDYRNRKLWGQKSLVNIAHSGNFSIDRTTFDYVQDIWHVSPVTLR